MHLWAGKYEEAIDEYSTALHVLPTHFKGERERESVCVLGEGVCGYVCESLPFFSLFYSLRLNPLLVSICVYILQALFSRAFAYDKIGLIERAVDGYTAALGLEPENAFAYYNR